MTIRQRIKDSIIFGFLGELIAFGLIVPPIVVGKGKLTTWSLIVVISGGILLLLSIVYLSVYVKCPKCRHSILWSNVNLEGLQPWSVWKEKHCPFCYVALDTEIHSRA
jgi:hypothetical protein